MATLESTLIHLAPAQKKRLARLAKKRQTSLASEVRSAIECYLAIGAEGVDPQEIAAAAKEARQAVESMTAGAKRANKQLEAALQQIRRPKRRAS